VKHSPQEVAEKAAIDLQVSHETPDDMYGKMRIDKRTPGDMRLISASAKETDTQLNRNTERAIQLFFGAEHVAFGVAVYGLWGSATLLAFIGMGPGGAALVGAATIGLPWAGTRLIETGWHDIKKGLKE